MRFLPVDMGGRSTRALRFVGQCLSCRWSRTDDRSLSALMARLPVVERAERIAAVDPDDPDGFLAHRTHIAVLAMPDPAAAAQALQRPRRSIGRQIVGA